MSLVWSMGEVLVDEERLVKREERVVRRGLRGGRHAAVEAADISTLA